MECDRFAIPEFSLPWAGMLLRGRISFFFFLSSRVFLILCQSAERFRRKAGALRFIGFIPASGGRNDSHRGKRGKQRERALPAFCRDAAGLKGIIGFVRTPTLKNGVQNAGELCSSRPQPFNYYYYY